MVEEPNSLQSCLVGIWRTDRTREVPSAIFHNIQTMKEIMWINVNLNKSDRMCQISCDIINFEIWLEAMGILHNS